MNNTGDQTDAQDPAATPAGRTQALERAAADRRRLLLKGVGRGSALLAATVPLKTLAGQRVITRDSTQCTLSGMQSGFHSANPANSPVCSGVSIPVYGSSKTNWPASVKPLAACNSVFKSCTLMQGAAPASLFYVVSKYPNTDDAHWVCAWLNSMNPKAKYFPYSTAEVVAHYNDVNKRANALKFYRTYTEF